MTTPKGHSRRHGARYEIAVPMGRDPVTGRYRYAYDYARDLESARHRRDELIRRIMWRWIGENPAQLATVPRAVAQITDRLLRQGRRGC